MFNRILVAHDGSPGARKALQLAIHFAKQYEAELSQITVKECFPRYVEEVGGSVGLGRVLSTEQEATDYSHQVCTEGSRAATAVGVKLIPHAVHGDALDEIARIMREQGFVLLVVGYNGHSASIGHDWGSTSQQLVQLIACNVLVVKGCSYDHPLGNRIAHCEHIGE